MVVREQRVDVDGYHGDGGDTMDSFDVVITAHLGTTSTTSPVRIDGLVLFPCFWDRHERKQICTILPLSTLSPPRFLAPPAATLGTTNNAYTSADFW